MASVSSSTAAAATANAAAASAVATAVSPVTVAAATKGAVRVKLTCDLARKTVVAVEGKTFADAVTSTRDDNDEILPPITNRRMMNVISWEDAELAMGLEPKRWRRRNVTSLEETGQCWNGARKWEAAITEVERLLANGVDYGEDTWLLRLLRLHAHANLKKSRDLKWAYNRWTTVRHDDPVLDREMTVSRVELARINGHSTHIPARGHSGVVEFGNMNMTTFPNKICFTFEHALMLKKYYKSRVQYVSTSMSKRLAMEVARVTEQPPRQLLQDDEIASTEKQRQKGKCQR